MTQMQEKRKRLSIDRVYKLLSKRWRSIRDLCKKTGDNYDSHMIRSRLHKLVQSGAVIKQAGKGRPSKFRKADELF